MLPWEEPGPFGASFRATLPESGVAAHCSLPSSGECRRAAALTIHQLEGMNGQRNRRRIGRLMEHAVSGMQPPTSRTCLINHLILTQPGGKVNSFFMFSETFPKVFMKKFSARPVLPQGVSSSIINRHKEAIA